MPQNETNELATLAAGVVGLLRRRRGLGLRRTPAIPAAAPPAARPRPAVARPAQPAAPAQGQPQNGAPAAEAAQAAGTRAPGAQPPAAAPQAAPAPPAAQQAPEPYKPPVATPAPAALAQPGGTTAPEPVALDLSGYQSLEELGNAAQSCTACGLSKSRRNVFMGFGQGSSGVLFIDETPGAAADAGGSPFQGPSGELLGNIVTKGMGLPMDAVQLISLVKCQPHAGAPPEPSELSTCRSWLERQMEWLQPKVIVTLGRPASAAVLGLDAPLGRLRGQLHTAFGRPVVVTFHPEYLVRSPQYKKQAWEDIQLAMSTAGIPIPTRK